MTHVYKKNKTFVPNPLVSGLWYLNKSSSYSTFMKFAIVDRSERLPLLCPDSQPSGQLFYFLKQNVLKVFLFY